jgi:hypothetical protein
MDFKALFTKKRLIFLVIFAVLVLVGKNINFAPLVGAENQFFTLFQFFGPIPGAFLGSVFGVIAILIAQLIDFVVVGKEVTWINVMRLAPMLFAAYYFGSKKRNLNVIFPAIAIGIFLLHPVGRQAWFYSLFWTIPIIARLLPAKYSLSVPLRSLGATFTAHAIGGALWIWTVPMTKAMYVTLLPITFYERILFAAGIGISYVALNVVLDKVLDVFKIKIPSDILRLDEKFTVRG